MHGQIEGAVVDRHQHLALDVDVRLQGFLRLHVDVRPLRIVGPGFYHRQVEGAVLLADFLETLEIAAVAAEEDARAARLDDPGRPQRRIAVAQAAARKVLGRRRHQLDAVDVGGLPPRQLPHLAGRDAPRDQPVAHAQRRDEMLGLAGQRQHGGVVQVVVVVVRQDDALDRRQLFYADGRLVETGRTGPLHRRRALGKHGIGQPQFAVQLQ